METEKGHSLWLPKLYICGSKSSERGSPAWDVWHLQKQASYSEKEGER